MKCYLLIKKGLDDVLTPQAVCGTEDAAKAAAIDGEYLIIPVTVDELYDTLLDQGLPGTIIYEKEGLATLIAQARQAISNLDSSVSDLTATLESFITKTTTKFSQVQTAVANINANIAALEARVAALEG